MSVHVLVLCTHNSVRSVLAEGMPGHRACKLDRDVVAHSGASLIAIIGGLTLLLAALVLVLALVLALVVLSRRLGGHAPAPPLGQA
jgi:hypothetical protein